MDITKLSRPEREKVYIEQMTKLQLHWKNPLDGDWNFVTEWTDDQLNKATKDTIGQLKFEMSSHYFGKLIIFLVLSFVGLVILGLLVFGIKQLF